MKKGYGGYKSLINKLNPKSAPGSQWVSVDEKDITTLKEFHSLELEKALKKKEEEGAEGPHSFTKKELASFKLCSSNKSSDSQRLGQALKPNLLRNSYIQVDKKYFTPCEDFESDQHTQRRRTTKIIEFIKELEERKIIKVDTVAWDKYASEAEKRAINRAGFLFGKPQSLDL